MTTITDVKTFLTCPDDVDLVVVRVETNQPGLYGLGCATFTQRSSGVVQVINDYLRPLVLGKDVSEIQELWHLMAYNPYWRNGPVVNNAVSGIDMALWDIKGKMAAMPLYDLLGGKCRSGLTVYRYANGNSRKEILAKVESLLNEGYHHIRLQYFPMIGHAQFQQPWTAKNAKSGSYQDPHKYIREMTSLFAETRKEFGWDFELIHDVHERLPAIDAIQFAKDLEQYRPYFLEDLFSTEQADWYARLRKMTTTPIAHGELCVNMWEWKPLIQDHLVDFIRIHPSMIGGITPAIKVAHFAELYGVRTAWHGPTDMTPIGFTAEMHLGLASPNFGIQEWPDFGKHLEEVFHGMPKMEKGYAYLSDKPGIGVEFDEKVAKKFPPKCEVPKWTEFRLTDGGLYTP